MPTYQYQCTECGEALEVQQSFSEDALTVCPACDGRLRKVFNAVGVVFKGSGFYRTDSRSSTNGSAGSDSAAPKKDAPKTDGPKKETTKSDSSSSSSSTPAPTGG